MKPCKLWEGALASNGYGAAWKDGHYISAHRKAYEDEHGPIPEGLVVRHKCDVRRCIELEHLELGTPADNTRDMVGRGRARGGRPRVHSPEVRAMVMALLSMGFYHKQIARMVRVSDAFVSYVRNNRAGSTKRSR